MGGLHVVRRRVYRSSRGRTRGLIPHVVRWSTDCPPAPPVGSNPPLIVVDRPGGDPNGSDGRIYGSRRNLTLASEGAYRSSPTGLTPEIDVGSVPRVDGCINNAKTLAIRVLEHAQRCESCEALSAVGKSD